MHPQVEAYILDLEPERREIAMLLRDLIMASAPGVEEQFKWKVPFYGFRGALCYINNRKQGLDLGFLQGYLLSDPCGVLQDRGTKQVRHLLLTQKEQLFSESFQQILQEALMQNEQKGGKGYSW